MRRRSRVLPRRGVEARGCGMRGRLGRAPWVGGRATSWHGLRVTERRSRTTRMGYQRQTDCEPLVMISLSQRSRRPDGREELFRSSHTQRPDPNIFPSSDPRPRWLITRCSSSLRLIRTPSQRSISHQAQVPARPLPPPQAPTASVSHSTTSPITPKSTPPTHSPPSLPLPTQTLIPQPPRLPLHHLPLPLAPQPAHRPALPPPRAAILRHDGRRPARRRTRHRPRACRGGGRALVVVAVLLGWGGGWAVPGDEGASRLGGGAGLGVGPVRGGGGHGGCGCDVEVVWARVGGWCCRLDVWVWSNGGSWDGKMMMRRTGDERRGNEGNWRNGYFTV